MDNAQIMIEAGDMKNMINIYYHCLLIKFYNFTFYLSIVVNKINKVKLFNV